MARAESITSIHQPCVEFFQYSDLVTARILERVKEEKNDATIRLILEQL